MVDLKPLLSEAQTNLIRWRNRYSPAEYPHKVVLNLFYRRHTMKCMWNEILAYADQRKGIKTFQNAYRELEILYSQTATTKIQPILESKLANNPTEDVGGSTFDHYNNLAVKAVRGDKAALNELEFCYLYFFLADEATLIWAAIAASGVDKVRAIAEVSGAIIQPMPLVDYATVSQGLGQLAAAPCIQKNSTI